MSIIGKRGICFSCGYDHGDGLGNPRMLDMLTNHAEAVLERDATIADLRAALAAKTEGAAMTVEPVVCAYMFVIKNSRLGQRRELAAIDYLPDPNEEILSKEPLGRFVPAVQQGGEAALKNAFRCAGLSHEDYLRVKAYLPVESQSAAAHPLLDGKSGEALQLLIEVNAALKLAWDRRELPANVIGGDLTRRIYAATKGAEKP